jgi:imidazolonepropionase-like amidohydrolase
LETLYKNAAILNGTGDRFDSHSLLVRDDKIATVAPADDFSGFGGEIVDLAGCTVLPGLVDCHVHILYGGEPNPGDRIDRMLPGEITVRGLLNARQTLAGGTTGIRDCGGQDYLEFAVRDACNRRDFVGPSIRAAGRMICMTGGHGNRAGRVADGVDEVVKAVREQIHAGCDLVKIMATGGVMTPGVNPEDAHYSAEEMAAGIAEGHRFHRKCASHAQGSEGILNAVRGGIDSIEHGIFMNDDCIREMIDSGTYLVPTLAAVSNILGGADQGIPEYVMEKAARVADAHRKSVTAFYEAGGRIAMGTDAGTPFNFHGNNAQELAFMVEVGIAPMDAIVFSTSNAADLVGLEGEGEIKEGNYADLLVVTGDPVVDISCVADKSNHRMVLKRGRTVAS